MRRACTTSRSPFAPRTHEAQFDEKWAFVAKLGKNCDEADPADDRNGDTWNHAALDAESRLVKIATRVVFRAIATVMAALGVSGVSRAINTAFVERQNGTVRHRNARKSRKTDRFSKGWRHHESVTYLAMCVYNFAWPMRTLRIQDDQRGWQTRSPAMAAVLAEHVRSTPERLAFPLTRRR